ncbi:MAG TPA: ABC transporter ATP-binding protein [Alphaproteobacteria bacterium]|nr:ABC transporter ATP-binding protein [Alphaproteobacteria bacterium]
MATEVLRLGGIDAFYGDSHVLHGVGFTVHAGRLLALLGRNGAGKTTCLNTVIGFLPTRRGAVALFGESIAGLPPETIARKGVGLVPQGRRVFRNLSVDENLQVAARPPLAAAKSSWSLERIYEVFPRLRERRAQAAGLLSGGEQQMLAIGRALMSNPRILLMDEPSEGLAPQIVHEVGRIIAALKADGLSIVLVEQNIKMSLNVADDVVLLNTGRVVYEGDVAGVRNDERLVAQHLGVF